jgi:hypothetical protein
MFQVPARKAKKLLKKGFRIICSVHYSDGYEIAFVSKSQRYNREVKA